MQGASSFQNDSYQENTQYFINLNIEMKVLGLLLPHTGGCISLPAKSASMEP